MIREIAWFIADVFAVDKWGEMMKQHWVSVRRIVALERLYRLEATQERG